MTGEQESQEQQHYECSEIHTIQVFRDASMITDCEPNSFYVQSPIVKDQNVTLETRWTMTPIPYLQTELPCCESKEHGNLTDGIGGDWAIEIDEDVMEEPSALLLPPNLQGNESSLYSFYFETPVVPMALQHQEQMSDDFTITSHDTESFHDNMDLNLTNLQDSATFWEHGLAPCSQEQISTGSLAQVSISGEDGFQL
jgi:hypothetical protein